ncbi:uncharacterized protein BO87DRAFT_415036 [Aspergillus neoniger CBS 115656]|uniref:Uncharacterized protein n=1 Tax=Aspergillus neoniger (strain CBS 115656) TaxID=1448310 RepID=A0A318Z598_ASPNB|nr:hypothetical protein BO87DRAFT_415036 [Aspergillus neoniger CBS 115656]PYH35348.1 hypothetical protein BO87DRAFT_415036 [Aspergillus neoniger CBS 115656]
MDLDDPPIELTPSPMRVLVQTLTHLVPSDNLIANGLQRWYSYGDEFGYNNRVCFFLLDYGTAPNGNDEEVPIQCFTWDGEKFIPKPDLLQSEEIQAELKEVPFTPGPSDRGEIPPMRDIVRRRLRKAQFLSKRELDYMAEHQEDQEWLERKLKPRFWANFLEQMEKRAKERETEREEPKEGQEVDPAQEEENRAKAMGK